ncbi:MAG: Cysteine-tRNA ligase [candidate division WWE3 bacterium GW2011_GWA1_46_21]|uniref:Cysteine-tRNA ligase n=1 Tax=candidate division WWE3 bacterium GW2011_GWA1_46_21 TaxID=1619107 RepID=A0A0G1PBI6_UNCKA|nr:MAG: Cysteine-tRNA ligase [candidate division WWE3 bacterium GW2011_GWA1_46_21]
MSIEHIERFREFIDDDINMPKAVSVMWEMLKSEIPESSKIRTLLEMDRVLGLGVEDYVGFEIPKEIIDMAATRWQYKISGIWDKADLMRREVLQKGYVIEDATNSYKVKRKL